MFMEEPHRIYICQNLDDVVEYTDWVHFKTFKGFTVFGVDVESTGLDPWSDEFRVTLVQISDGDETYIIPPTVTGAIEALHGTLENPKVKIATHSQFDTVALCTLGIVVGPKVIDTYILSRLLSPGNEHPHGLKPLTQQWLKAEELVRADEARHEFFKAEAAAHAPKGTMRSTRKIESWGWQSIDPLAHEVLEYAGLDAIAVRILAPVLVKELTDRGVPCSLIEQELWLGTVATSMRLSGMKVDTERVHNLLQRYEQEMKDAADVITTVTGLPSPLSPKRVEWLQERGVKFDPARVTEKGRPQLDKDALPDLCAKYPDGDVGLVLQCSLFLSERKNAVANLTNFLAHSDADGYVHPEIKTLGARTGRMSVVNPALQTLKKSDPELRGCFIAEPGSVLISADFSQIEIRVAAALSGDRELSAPILNGEDTHDSTARHLYGDDFTKDQRQVAKQVNFGSLYGGGAGTLSKQAGIGMDEARSVVTKWKSTYKQVAHMSHVLSGMHVIVNPAGRRIPSDPERGYANLNYLIQSTARDLFVVAVRRIVERLGAEYLWMFVHDEVILQAPLSQAEAVRRVVQEEMTFTFYGIPVDAEAEVLGVRWGGDDVAA
jgi:DNA polymerase-1